MISCKISFLHTGHLPYMQQASYLEGGPLMLMLPLYLLVNQKSVDDDDDDYLYAQAVLNTCTLQSA